MPETAGELAAATTARERMARRGADCRSGREPRRAAGRRRKAMAMALLLTLILSRPKYGDACSVSGTARQEGGVQGRQHREAASSIKRHKCLVHGYPIRAAAPPCPLQGRLGLSLTGSGALAAGSSAAEPPTSSIVWGALLQLMHTGSNG